jgi:hypothetical protein
MRSSRLVLKCKRYLAFTFEHLMFGVTAWQQDKYAFEICEQRRANATLVSAYHHTNARRERHHDDYERIISDDGNRCVTTPESLFI